MRKTGLQGYRILEEYYLDDDTPTGRQKPNLPEDPDYIPPFPNYEACPIGEEANIPEGNQNLSLTLNGYPIENAILFINGISYRGAAMPENFEANEGLNVVRLELINGRNHSITVNLRENGNLIYTHTPGTFNTLIGNRWAAAIWGAQAGATYLVEFEVEEITP